MLLTRKHELDRLEMSINKQQKSVVADRRAFEIKHIDRVAAQEHAEAAKKRRSPFLVAHFVAVRIEPHHITNFRSADSPPLEKFRPAEDRMVAPKLDQLLRKRAELFLLFVVLPRQPACFVILTISVVV